MTYPGGKGRIFQQIISLIPPHRVYIETHLGGGAVMRAKRPAELSFGIERDSAVAAQWRDEGFPGLSIVEQDAAAWIRNHAFRGDEFVYCDPPYLPSTRRRPRVYRHDLGEADHIRLLALLRTLPCPVMISGYPSDLYDRHLEGWRIVDLKVPSQTGLRDERLWLNYDPDVVLHDHSHIGRSFRDREAIRRRRATIVKKVERLSPVEKSAVLAEIAAGDPRAFLWVAALVDGSGAARSIRTGYGAVEASGVAS